MKAFIIATLLAFCGQYAYADTDMCAEITIQDLRVKSDIKQFASEHYKSNSINIRNLIGCNDWYIVELESKDFEPVIVVINKAKTVYYIKAEWGGIVEEGGLKQVIRDYFMKIAPEMPTNLLDCLDPKGPPFVKVQ